MLSEELSRTEVKMILLIEFIARRRLLLPLELAPYMAATGRRLRFLVIGRTKFANSLYGEVIIENVFEVFMDRKFSTANEISIKLPIFEKFSQI